MNKLLKLTWKDKINNWIGMFLYKRIGIKSGPFMFYSRGQWWFIDFQGSIWLIRYTDSYDSCPLEITLFKKA